MSQSVSGTGTVAGPGAPEKKFNPGHYMMTWGIPSSAEMDLFSVDYSAHPDLFSGIAGQWRWHQFENNTVGDPVTGAGYDFSTVASSFNYLQSVAPGASLCIGIACYSNCTVYNNDGISGHNELATYNPRFGGVPLYILQNPTTYGAGTTGCYNNYGGFCYQNWNGTNWSYMGAALWRSSVMNRYNKVFQALLNSNCLPPYQGVQYTIETHPLIEYVFDWMPTDLPMAGDPAKPADYSSSQWGFNWNQRPQFLGPLAPHVSFGLMPGYGANNPNEPPSDQKTLVQNMNAYNLAMNGTDIFARTLTFTSAPTGSGGNLTQNPNTTGIYPLAFSDGQMRYANLTSNSVAVTWSPSLSGTSRTVDANMASPTYAQWYYLGRNYDGSTLTGGVDQRNAMACLHCIQGFDYSYGGGSHDQTQTQYLRDNAVNLFSATHILWNTGDIYGTPQYWENNVRPILSQSGNATRQTRPTNYS